MKLKVVDDYERHAWIEADTIDTLKAKIMNHFSLTADDLSQRLLVADDRDLIADFDPITGCVDLLQLEDGDLCCNCKDGDTLLLGWKRPCIVRLVINSVKGHNIEVDNSYTLRELKQEIERLTGEPVTAENLPQVLFNGDDDKPLLFFGYYRFCKANGLDFEIHRDKFNQPVGRGPVLRIATYPTQARCTYFSDSMEEEWAKLSVRTIDDNGEESFIPFKDFYNPDNLKPESESESEEEEAE